MFHGFVEKGCRLGKKAHKKLSTYKEVTEVKKILIIRHAAMGDMIHTRPFLVELKKLFPNASLILGLVSHYQYFAPIDLVDEVIITDTNKKIKKSFFRQIKELKKFPKVDLLFDLADTSRSRLISFFTKANVKFGFPYSSFIFPYDVAIYRSDLRFEAENILEFLWFFGHNPNRPLDYHWPKENFRTQRPVHELKKQILCFFGVSDPNRAYPRDHWKKFLVTFLNNHPEIEILVAKGTKPWEDLGGLLEEIKKEMTFKTFPLKSDEQSSSKSEVESAPKYDADAYSNAQALPRLTQLPFMSMEDLGKIMSESMLFISNDTGPRHLALALGVPTASFFHSTCPGRNFPYAALNAHQHLLLATIQGEHLAPLKVFEKVSNHLEFIYPDRMLKNLR